MRDWRRRDERRAKSKERKRYHLIPSLCPFVFISTIIRNVGGNYGIHSEQGYKDIVSKVVWFAVANGRVYGMHVSEANAEAIDIIGAAVS